MKIFSISMVRNEADIVEAWVRHTVSHVDRMIVVCHASLDNTPAILEALAAEGLPLDVRRHHTIAHKDALVRTKLMREAAVCENADWVLPLDADEFVIPAEGLDPRSAIDRLPDDCFSLLPLVKYVPTPADRADELNVLRRIRNRGSAPQAAPGRKAIIPLRLARRSHALLAKGGHKVVNTRTGSWLPSQLARAPALAHFPVRSSDQVRLKYIVGWISTLADPLSTTATAGHWRQLFEECLDTDTFDAAQLQALAVRGQTTPDERDSEFLELAPIPASFELRYELQPVELVTVLARAAVGLAAELGAARRPSRRAAAFSERLRRAQRKLHSLFGRGA